MVILLRQRNILHRLRNYSSSIKKTKIVLHNFVHATNQSKNVKLLFTVDSRNSHNMESNLFEQYHTHLIFTMFTVKIWTIITWKRYSEIILSHRIFSVFLSFCFVSLFSIMYTRTILPDQKKTPWQKHKK